MVALRRNQFGLNQGIQSVGPRFRELTSQPATNHVHAIFKERKGSAHSLGDPSWSLLITHGASHERIIPRRKRTDTHLLPAECRFYLSNGVSVVLQ